MKVHLRMDLGSEFEEPNTCDFRVKFWYTNIFEGDDFADDYYSC